MSWELEDIPDVPSFEPPANLPRISRKRGLKDNASKPMTGNPSQFPFEQHLHGGRADQPVLSEASINELLSLGGDAGLDLVVELVDLFLGDSVQRLTQAREGLESSQPEEVSRAAHALKSSSANMGAMAFSALCAEMEQKGRDGELEALTDSIQRMDEMYAELESALRALRETCVQ